MEANSIFILIYVLSYVLNLKIYNTFTCDEIVEVKKNQFFNLVLSIVLNDE